MPEPVDAPLMPAAILHAAFIIAAASRAAFPTRGPMISIRAQKTLWGRAAGRCSFPDCRREVFFEEQASNPTLIGENCHIISESGPRAHSNFPEDERNSYSNLILLCRNHHKVIDDPENGEKSYPVEKLREIKLAHEAWVREQLCFDLGKQQDEEAYADIIDQWEICTHLDEWSEWSWWILAMRCPSMKTAVSSELDHLRRWILCRVWPRRYPKLEDALENFRRVLEVFQNTFYEHADLREEEFKTRKFYSGIGNRDEYDALAEKYDHHVHLLADLMLELTRAANLICDLVRSNILYGYRRKQGRVLATNGVRDWVAEYSTDERKLRFPFGGLDSFLLDRQSRDFCFGGKAG